MGDIWGLFQADGLEIIALWIMGYGIVNQSSLWDIWGLFQADGLEIIALWVMGYGIVNQSSLWGY